MLLCDRRRMRLDKKKAEYLKSGCIKAAKFSPKPASILGTTIFLSILKNVRNLRRNEEESDSDTERRLIHFTIIFFYYKCIILCCFIRGAYARDTLCVHL